MYIHICICICICICIYPYIFICMYTYVYDACTFLFTSWVRAAGQGRTTFKRCHARPREAQGLHQTPAGNVHIYIYICVILHMRLYIYMYISFECRCHAFPLEAQGLHQTHAGNVYIYLYMCDICICVYICTFIYPLNADVMHFLEKLAAWIKRLQVTCIYIFIYVCYLYMRV